MTIPVTSAAQRRAEITDAIRRETGIEEAMIERLVRGFYGRVRDDAVIGPVFAARIADWEPHLARMCAFWSSVALMTGRYHGQPMQKHLPLPVDAAHFDRWLALFEATARDLCPPKAADHFIERARRIAESLELGIAGAHGALLRKGERFERPGLHATEGATVQDALPAGMKAYKRTPVFDQESLPAGLRRSHCTKAGVWALIHVLQGSLQYRTFDPASETELTPQKPGVVRPGQLHEVQPLGPVRMFVEFYAAADVGSRPRARRLLSSSCGASEPDAPKRVRRNSERLVDRNGKRL
jgi:hemoglobin